MHTPIAPFALDIARERQEQEIARVALERRFATPRPSIRRSAAASSRSVSGSPRSHRWSWLGPARGSASSPEPEEILS